MKFTDKIKTPWELFRPVKRKWRKGQRRQGLPIEYVEYFYKLFKERYPEKKWTRNSAIEQALVLAIYASSGEYHDELKGSVQRTYTALLEDILQKAKARSEVIAEVMAMVLEEEEEED